MKQTRRTILGAGLCLGALVALASPASLANPARQARPHRGGPAHTPELVYIGMHGNKITAARFDSRTGALQAIGPVADNARPTWGVKLPGQNVIVYNEEAGNGGEAQGGVQTWQVDPRSGALTKLSDVRAGGGGTTYLWFDAPSRTLLAANYGGGSLATFHIGADGTIGPLASLTKFTGSGPHRRQGSAHAHAVSVDPSRHWALVTDLGSDRIWVLPFDPRSGAVGAFDPASAHHYVAPPGSGPRHMAWSANGKVLRVVDELTAHVDTFGWDAAAGRLTLRQSLPTDSPGFKGDSSASELVESRDGRFVYVANRGESTIVAYRTLADGTLRQVQRVASGGALPWNIVLHRSGRWLLVANRDSNTVNVIAVDPASGRLTATAQSLSTPQPVHTLPTGI